MVSATLLKISSPLTRSCLIAISVAIVIDAVLTIFAAATYPYLIDYYFDDLYIDSSRSITVVYSGISIAAILVAISTAVAIYKSSTNYVLITKFSCCGVDSVKDWVEQWNHYITPSCCKERAISVNSSWAKQFGLKDLNHEFEHCNETEAYAVGCLSALKEDEYSKYAWISDLIVFLIVITLANTIVSLLLFGLSKTEDIPNDIQDNELAIIGLSTKPRPSQPTITGIRPRVSVVQTLGPNPDQVTSISHAVRFNLTHSRPSIVSTNSKSKFSPAARRGSSFL